MISIAGKLAEVKFNVSFLCVNNWCFEVRENISHEITLTSPAARGEIIFENPLSFRLFIKNIGGSISNAFPDNQTDKEKKYLENIMEQEKSVKDFIEGEKH